MAQDISSDLAVVIPDAPSQAAILRLLINDEGGIDSVVVENSYFPAKVERRLIEAFSRLRFLPGKIGRIPVRSQLKIEVMLESPTQLFSNSPQDELSGERYTRQ